MEGIEIIQSFRLSIRDRVFTEQILERLTLCDGLWDTAKSWGAILGIYYCLCEMIVTFHPSVMIRVN